MHIGDGASVRAMRLNLHLLVSSNTQSLVLQHVLQMIDLVRLRAGHAVKLLTAAAEAAWFVMLKGSQGYASRCP